MATNTPPRPPIHPGGFGAARGEKLLVEAVQLALNASANSPLPLLFAAFAHRAVLQGHTEQAMKWLGCMDRALQTMHTVLVGPEVIEYASTVALARQRALDAKLETWRAQGRALTLQDALARLHARPFASVLQVAKP